MLDVLGFLPNAPVYVVFVNGSTDEDVVEGKLNWVPNVGDIVSFAVGAFRQSMGVVVGREVTFNFRHNEIVVRVRLDPYKIDVWPDANAGFE